MRTLRILPALALASALFLSGPAAGADEDERLAERVAKIDPIFLKALAGFERHL